MYVPVTCQSSKTIALARSLYSEFGIEAWTPRIENKKPKKGEKRIRPGLPGFVFIPLESIEDAKLLSSRLQVPKFTSLIFFEKEATCTMSELQTFDRALRDTQIPESVSNKGLAVGNHVKITSGPLEGIEGEVFEIYVDKCLMVKIKSGVSPDIRLPAVYIG